MRPAPTLLKSPHDATGGMAGGQAERIDAPPNVPTYLPREEAVCAAGSRATQRRRLQGHDHRLGSTSSNAIRWPAWLLVQSALVRGPFSRCRSVVRHTMLLPTASLRVESTKEYAAQSQPPSECTIVISSRAEEGDQTCGCCPPLARVDRFDSLGMSSIEGPKRESHDHPRMQSRWRRARIMRTPRRGFAINHARRHTHRMPRPRSRFALSGS